MISIIPARGNSKGIPRKNLAVIDGKPLLVHIAETCRSVREMVGVVVSTEDPEIRSVALSHGYQVIDRPAHLSEDDVPVSEVARHALETLDHQGPFLIAQPTVPHVTPETIRRLIAELENHEVVTLAAPNTHILRGPNGRLTPPTNRQLLSGIWREVGVRAFRWPPCLDAHPTGVVHIEGREAIDIDTYGDLYEAQATKRINIRYIENRLVGTGHRHRALSLAAALGRHDVTIGKHRADVQILDVLDTTEQEVAELKTEGAKVVTIEDRGPGARLADLVINALYPHGGLAHELSGPDYADLRPEFVGLPPYEITGKGRILAMFGGTDPSGLGERIHKLFPNATWIRPGASVSVAWQMMNHDLLITSAGRTVYEAQAVGIPCVVLAQNHREMQHLHLDGTVFLGLGGLVSDAQVNLAVLGVLGDENLRRELSRRRVDGRGLERIVRAIESL